MQSTNGEGFSYKGDGIPVYRLKRHDSSVKAGQRLRSKPVSGGYTEFKLRVYHEEFNFDQEKIQGPC